MQVVRSAAKCSCQHVRQISFSGLATWAISPHAVETVFHCLCGLQVREERDALEAMRLDFEHELQQAQAEVAKAQDALKTAEDRVRAVEQVERQKIISGVD